MVQVYGIHPGTAAAGPGHSGSIAKLMHVFNTYYVFIIFIFIYMYAIIITTHAK